MQQDKQMESPDLSGHPPLWEAGMTTTTERKPVILGLGQGRGYDCGTMSAVFKVDRPETDDRYSVSEWWLEPQSKGPGAHSHADNDELFFVIEGQPSILVGDTWYDSPVGSFVMVPATVIHDFENRTDARAGLLNVYVPGGFEDSMPAIVEWFRNNQS
ncbi:MAG: cupin domain-containing protein [Pseudaminobacter sp.]